MMTRMLHVEFGTKRHFMTSSMEYYIKGYFQLPTLDASGTKKEPEYCGKFVRNTMKIILQSWNLAMKMIRQGYYWPTAHKDAYELVCKYDRYQKFVIIPRLLSHELTLMSNS